MPKDSIKLHVQALPNQPGVYQFYDKKEVYLTEEEKQKVGNRFPKGYKKVRLLGK